MSDTVEDRRAVRLAQLAEREAEDRARAADDAELDLPVLLEALALVEGDFEALVARLVAASNSLVRKTSTVGHSLPAQVEVLGQLRNNFRLITGALADEARALIVAGQA